MKTLLRLAKLITSLIPVIILAVIFGTLGHLCAIAIPVLASVSITGLFPFGFLVIFGLARGILHYAEQYCNHFLAFTVLAKIRSVVFKKLRDLGPAKLEGHDKGDLISLLTSDIELLEVFYAHTISPVCIAFLTALAMCIFFAQIHWSMIFVALFFYVMVGIILPFAVNKTAVKLGLEHRTKFANLNTFVLDCLRGLEQSILYGNGFAKLAEMKNRSDDLSASRKKLSVHEGLTAALSGLAVTLGGLSMLILSLILYKKGIIDYGKAIIATVGMFSSFGPAIAVSILGSSLSGTIASGKRVLALLDENPLVEEVSGNPLLADFTGAYCKNVNFSYQKENQILSDVNIDFPRNKIIGIQGKSGSGKSTLLKLFMHFWQADSGKIEISDTPIEKINTKNLRQMESFVTQETVLFHDTIENNIRIAKLDATEEEIKNACKKAQIHDFISSLPDGYKTKVAELGDNFSGGERQRLGLARAFLHGGDFILLDEPTSNLDSYNEHQIMQAVKNESQGKTVVIVSHRDSTFEFTDKIFKMESGRNS